MKCDQFMEHVRSIIMNRENIFKNNHTIEKNYEKISQIKKGPDLRWAKEWIANPKLLQFITLVDLSSYGPLKFTSNWII